MNHKDDKYLYLELDYLTNKNKLKNNNINNQNINDDLLIQNKKILIDIQNLIEEKMSEKDTVVNNKEQDLLKDNNNNFISDLDNIISKNLDSLIYLIKLKNKMLNNISC